MLRRGAGKRQVIFLVAFEDRRGTASRIALVIADAAGDQDSIFAFAPERVAVDEGPPYLESRLSIADPDALAATLLRIDGVLEVHWFEAGSLREGRARRE